MKVPWDKFLNKKVKISYKNSMDEIIYREGYVDIDSEWVYLYKTKHEGTESPDKYIFACEKNNSNITNIEELNIQENNMSQPKLSKKEFKKYMNLYKSELNRNYKANKCFTELGLVDGNGALVDIISYKLIDSYVSLLEVIMEDKEQFISWFIYDTDFGSNPLSIYIGGDEYSINNLDQLYYLLINDMKKLKRKSYE